MEENNQHENQHQEEIPDFRITETHQEETVETINPFVIDEADKENVCENCNILRNGTKVCATYKNRLIYRMSKGYKDDKSEFYCGDFEIVK